MAAFEAARRLGAAGVELDVRLTADGEPVVHHDVDVPGLGPVAATPRAALPPWIPGLGEALGTCAGLLVNVELKLDPPHDGPAGADGLADATLAALDAAGPGTAVVLSSFRPEALAAAAARRPDLPLGLLVHPAVDPAALIDVALSLGCRALHPHCGATDAALVERSHAAGLAVATWTPDTGAELAAAFAAGVDCVITDDVALALAVRGGGGPTG